MIDQINSILDIIIKVSIVGGIIFVYFQYLKIGGLDKKIEQEHDAYDNIKKTNAFEFFAIKNKEKEVMEERDFKIGKLERARNSILERLPFLK